MRSVNVGNMRWDPNVFTIILGIFEVYKQIYKGKNCGTWRNHLNMTTLFPFIPVTHPIHVVQYTDFQQVLLNSLWVFLIFDEVVSLWKHIICSGRINADLYCCGWQSNWIYRCCMCWIRWRWYRCLSLYILWYGNCFHYFPCAYVFTYYLCYTVVSCNMYWFTHVVPWHDCYITSEISINYTSYDSCIVPNRTPTEECRQCVSPFRCLNLNVSQNFEEGMWWYWCGNRKV